MAASPVATVRTRAALAFFLAIVCAAVCLSTCSFRGEPRSVAALSISPGIKQDVEIEAGLTLPRVTGNRKWYGIWLMAVGSGSPEPFLQIGLARTEPNPAHPISGYGVTPFVAWTRRGEPLYYLGFPVLKSSSRPHRFVVGRHGNTLFVSMDGSVLHRERADDILSRYEAPEFQLAAELFAYGDRAVGTITNIHLRVGRQGRVVAFKPSSYLDDRGICLIPTLDGYRAAGTFNVVAPQIFRRDLPRGRTACR